MKLNSNPDTESSGGYFKEAVYIIQNMQEVRTVNLET
jgi:hypothetical protein